jgi:hypothetical protein
MYFNMFQINEAEHLGNDWGFYVDIELSTTNSNQQFINEKHRINYYNRCDKIPEEPEYYDYKYNNMNEEKSKQSEEINIYNKTLSSSLLCHISSLSLFTVVLSYCFIRSL